MLKYQTFRSTFKHNHIFQYKTVFKILGWVTNERLFSWLAVRMLTLSKIVRVVDWVFTLANAVCMQKNRPDSFDITIIGCPL